jgi:hypothetical protein
MYVDGVTGKKSYDASKSFYSGDVIFVGHNYSGFFLPFPMNFPEVKNCRLVHTPGTLFELGYACNEWIFVPTPVQTPDGYLSSPRFFDVLRNFDHNRIFHIETFVFLN